MSTAKNQAPKRSIKALWKELPTPWKELVTVGIAVAGLLVAVAQLTQQTADSASQQKIDATTNAILKQQLDVQNAIGTKQAEIAEVGNGPEATALAADVDALRSTQTMLQSELERVQNEGNSVEAAGEVAPVDAEENEVSADPPEDDGQLELGPSQAPLGQPLENNGLQMNLVKAEIRSSTDGGSAAARLWFAFLNKSPGRLLVEFDRSQVYIEDATGARYLDADGDETFTFWLDPGKTRIVDRPYTLRPGESSRISPSAWPVTVRVDDLPHIGNAEWVISTEPTPTVDNRDGMAGLGEAIAFGDFQVTLSDIEIRSTSDSGSAAFRVWFSVKNNSLERKLFEVDFAHIFIEDSFGGRYIDYDGVGIVSRWVEGQAEFAFDRPYGREYQTSSRMPPGTSYVLVVFDSPSTNTRGIWRVDVNR